MAVVTSPLAFGLVKLAVLLAGLVVIGVPRKTAGPDVVREGM